MVVENPRVIHPGLHGRDGGARVMQIAAFSFRAGRQEREGNFIDSSLIPGKVKKRTSSIFKQHMMRKYFEDDEHEISIHDASIQLR